MKLTKTEHTSVSIHPSDFKENVHNIIMKKKGSYELYSKYIRKIVYIYPSLYDNIIDKNGYILVNFLCIVEYIYYFIGEIMKIDSDFIYTNMGTIVNILNCLKIIIPDTILSNNHKLIEIVDISVKRNYLCIGTCI